MAKVLRLNYLIFIVLYNFYLKVETFADVMMPNLNNMVEYEQKPYSMQGLREMDVKHDGYRGWNESPLYDHVAVDIQRSNPEEVSFPKIKKKKHKKKTHKKKSDIADNEITGKVKTKKFKKKITRKFMKTAPKNADFSSIESGELKKRSPVDIIVHIKMNE